MNKMDQINKFVNEKKKNTPNGAINKLSKA